MFVRTVVLGNTDSLNYADNDGDNGRTFDLANDALGKSTPD